MSGINYFHSVSNMKYVILIFFGIFAVISAFMPKYENNQVVKDNLTTDKKHSVIKKRLTLIKGIIRYVLGN